MNGPPITAQKTMIGMMLASFTRSRLAAFGLTFGLAGSFAFAFASVLFYCVFVAAAFLLAERHVLRLYRLPPHEPGVARLRVPC
mgnify:CR=1 FL=1